jgi:hypothetical protein
MDQINSYFTVNRISVPWHDKTYGQILDMGMLPMVEKHIREKLYPAKRHDDYIKQLKTMQGFPQSFMQDLVRD